MNHSAAAPSPAKIKADVRAGLYSVVRNLGPGAAPLHHRRPIVTALRMRDSDAAVEAMRAHLSRVA